MAAGLRLSDVYFDQFREGLAQQRDRLCDGLADLGLRVIAPQGTYFATTDVRRQVRHRRGILISAYEAGVVAIPQSALERSPERPAHTFVGRSANSPQCSTKPLVRLRRWLG